MKADVQHDTNAATETLRTQLASLHLSYVLEHFESLASEAAAQNWSHVEYLVRLIEGEVHRREERSIARRVSLARFPVIKTLDQFQWSWPKKINRLQVQNLFRLTFVEEKANVIFLGGVGLGKSHLSIALAHTACLHGYSVLFTTAIRYHQHAQRRTGSRRTQTRTAQVSQAANSGARRAGLSSDRQAGR